MVEIKAKLTRLPVYFANEIVNCIVTFTNNSSSEEIEQLAWCVVQIHCLLLTDDNKISLTNKKQNNKLDKLKEEQILKSNLTSNRDTAFHPLKDERGQVVYSTEPKFLFCDLKLKSKESQSFNYNDKLFDYSPPSFNGQSIKYFYKITIGIQRVNSTIKLLRMPFKVLNLPSLKSTNDEDKNDDDNLNKSTNSNFSIQSIDNLNSIDDLSNCSQITNLILQKLDYLSSRRTLSNFIITNHLGKVGKFCIFKSIFKLGDDIIGLFDFKDSDIPCVQFTVTLQSEEIINDNCKSTKLKNDKNYKSQLTNYSEYQEICIHSLNSQINLPIPLTITPTFETDLVKLNWRLYFEFVTTRPEELDNTIYEDNFGQLELSPKELNVQTMIWELPITILPTNPTKIGQGLQLPDTTIITI